MAIKEISFGPKRYLTLKKSIAISQVTDKQMYDDAGKKLNASIEQNGLTREGGWAVLYFTWDEADQKTEIGISVPIVGAGQNTVNDSELMIIDIPQSKAAMDVLHGPYEGLGEIHQSLMKYVKEKGYDTTGVPVMAVEEYVIDPMSDPNPEHWETNIYYLHN